MSIEVRRAGDRFRTDVEGRTTWHSFSFDAHYDPANVSFGALVCHNDDRVRPGFGYADHPHRDLEIVTWVLEGALTHRSPSGAGGVLLPGQVRALSAGTGIVHSETVDPQAPPTRFLQTWVLPRTSGNTPAEAQADVRLVPDEPTALASGVLPDALVPIEADATLYGIRLTESTTLPETAGVHVFVASGTARLAVGEGLTLSAGDAARLTDAGGLRISGQAELLVWALDGRTR